MIFDRIVPISASGYCEYSAGYGERHCNYNRALVLYWALLVCTATVEDAFKLDNLATTRMLPVMDNMLLLVCGSGDGEDDEDRATAGREDDDDGRYGRRVVAMVCTMLMAGWSRQCI